jgi:hypothetical protein
VSHADDRNSDVERLSSFIFENDMFILDDGGYTNGFGYLWGYGPFDNFEERTPVWMDWLTHDLYIATLPGKQRRVSYSIFQEIYTPEEIVDKEPDPNDRPYAGLLMWEANWFAYDERIADRVKLELGLVGSASLGEQSQKLVHKITTANNPQGWNEQLDDEPIFRVGAQRNWRLQDGLLGPTEYDVIGLAHADAGTRRSDIGSGVVFRIGKGLGSSLANVSLTPARDVNLIAGLRQHWYAFVGLGGEYVANDITLDGNTFTNGPSVNIEHWQGSATVGAAWNLGNWGCLFSIRGITDEFDTQRKDSLYGSLSVSYHYAGD